jgi:hypothetical protein
MRRPQKRWWRKAAKWMCRQYHYRAPQLRLNQRRRVPRTGTDGGYNPAELVRRFDSAPSGAAQFRQYWGGTAQGHKEGHKTKRQALNARLALTPIGLRQLAPRVPVQCERRFAGLLLPFALPREVPHPGIKRTFRNFSSDSAHRSRQMRTISH